MRELSVTGQDFDGIVEYMLDTRGAEVSVLVYPRGESEMKVSFRSRTVNVAEAASSFGGGGHRLSAGCSMECGISEARERAVNALIPALEKDG